ncbi:MAG: MlaD family protein [Balneolaceae bacterium]
MSNELKIGIVILTSIIIAFAGFRVMSDAPMFRIAHQVQTTFDKVDGLNSGSVVYLNGVKIGSVRNISLTPDGRVLTTLGIEREIEIMEGATAYLTSLGLIDGKAIVIEQGSGDEPVPFDGRIDGVYVDSMVETLAGKGQELGDDITASFTELNHFLRQLNTTLDDPASESIGQTIQSLEQVTSGLEDLLDERQEELEGAISSASRTLARIDTVSEESGPRLERMIADLEVAAADLRGMTGELDQAVGRLNSVLSRIDEGEGTLGRLVQDPSLYENADSLSVELRDLIRELNENPGRFLRHLSLIELF